MKCFHQNKIFWIICIISISSLVFVAEFLYRDTYNKVSDITEFHLTYNAKSTPVTFDMISDAESYSNINIAGSYNKYSLVSVKSGKSSYVWASYVNPSYNSIYKLEFIKGGFFLNDENQILIDENLAYDLFMSADIVGFPVYIEDKEYIISGVYSKWNNFSASVASSQNIVFIKNDNIENIVSTLSIANYKNPNYFLAQLDNVLQHRLGSYFGSSLKDELEFVNIPRMIMICILLGFAIIILVRIVLKEGFAIKKLISNELTDYYLKKVISLKSKEILLSLFKILTLILICGLFIYLIFDFEIPSFLIPPKNIFDFSYYCSAIVNRINQENLIVVQKYYINFIHIRSIFIAMCYVCVFPITLYLFHILNENALK